MNLVWEPGKDEQGYVVCISVSCDNGQITSTKSNVENIFSKSNVENIFTTTAALWNVTKLWILKKWILSGQQEKIMGFEYCEEYLRSILNKILLWQC